MAKAATDRHTYRRGLPDGSPRFFGFRNGKRRVPSQGMPGTVTEIPNMRLRECRFQPSGLPRMPSADRQESSGTTALRMNGRKGFCQKKRWKKQKKSLEIAYRNQRSTHRMQKSDVPYSVAFSMKIRGKRGKQPRFMMESTEVCNGKCGSLQWKLPMFATESAEVYIRKQGRFRHRKRRCFQEFSTIPASESSISHHHHSIPSNMNLQKNGEDNGEHPYFRPGNALEGAKGVVNKI